MPGSMTRSKSRIWHAVLINANHLLRGRSYESVFRVQGRLSLKKREMNKKIVLVFIAAFLLACNTLTPRASGSTPEVIIPSPTESVLQPDDAPDVTLPGITIVRLHPSDGDLKMLLVQEAQKATELGL